MLFILPALGIVSCWLEFTLAHRLVHQGPSQIVLNADANDGNEVRAETANLPLDHTATNPTTSTFPNRFYVKPNWYKRGGPVFLYDGGEGAADDSYIQSPTDTDYGKLSFFEKFLKDHGGLGIVWEHRYYGESLPPGLNLSLSKEGDFKYLTTKQALADVEYFAKTFSRSGKLFAGLDLTPKKTPWIFVGCSYPGSRAALMRVAHSDTIFASYASSAPVQAVVDMPSYYEPIWSGMRKYGYTNCTADMHAAITAIDGRLDKNSAEAFKIKQQLFDCTDPPMSNGKFASYLSGLWNTWQGYGMGRDTSRGSKRAGLQRLCDYISFDPDAGKYSDARGWAKVHKDGVDFTLRRLRSWTGFKGQVGFGEKRTACPSTPPSAPSFTCDKDTDVDDISWKYQYCTEWGYLQVANVGDSQIVSKYYDLNFFRQQCLCQFETKSGPRAIPDTPKVGLINKQYGGWGMRPSRTFWTIGEFDPWSTLSPLKVDNHTIPECEASTAAGAPLFGHVLRNKQHCGDFDNTDPEAIVAQKLFSAGLKKWLCCFVESHKGNLNDNAKAVLCPSG